MSVVKIARIQDKIAKIASLDPNYKLFGANIHRYRFAPPIGDDAVFGLEKLWRVNLPADYRRWMTQVGNGGAGPGLGLCALRVDTKTFGDSFPGKDETFELLEADEEEEERWSNGTLELSNTGVGKGNSHILVVKGEAKGQVWLESSIDDIYWKPTADDFLRWMEDWAEDLYLLAKKTHQRRMKRMKGARLHERIYSLGRIYQRELGQARNADTWYERALDKDSENVNAALGRVECLNEIGDYQAVIKLARKYRGYCNPNPQKAESQNWIWFTHELGKALYARGYYKEAAKELDEAQERLQSEQVLYLPPRIAAHTKIGNYSQAKNLLAMAMMGTGTSLVDVERQAAVFLNREYPSEAMRTLRTLQALGFREEAHWLARLEREVEGAGGKDK